MESIVAEAPVEQRSGLAANALDFLRELLSAFETTFRGHHEAPTCSAGSTSSASGTALTDIAVATLQVGLDVGVRAHARGDRDRRRRHADGPRGHRHGPARRRRDGLRVRRRRPVRPPARGTGADEARRPPPPTPWRTRCAGCSASPRPTRRSRSTPTCGRRAGRARWCAACRRSASTTSAGSRSGRCRRCCAPCRSPATRSWARTSSP